MSKITRNTSFKIEKIEIINALSGEKFDVTSNLIDVAFYRSMKDVIGSGYINLVESLTQNGSFRKIAQMKGLEGINFVIKEADSKSGSTIDMFFLIYAVDNVQILKDTRTFTIRFTEAFGIANSFMRIGMKYSNMKCSDVVKKIGETTMSSQYTAVMQGFVHQYKPIFKERKIQPSTNNINFLVPMWHPLKAMLYFANASCTKDDIADCVLFTDHNGEFALLSFEDLFSGSTLGKLEFQYQFSGNISQDVGNEEEKRYNISQLSMSSIFNVQEFSKLGILGKRLYEADLYTLAGSQNEKQLGVPQLKLAGDDIGTGVYPYKDFNFEEIKNKASLLYDSGKEFDFETWLKAHVEATPDHLYNIVYYNGANDKNERVLETIIEPRDLRGDPVKNLLTYFKINIRIPLELTLDVGTMFTINVNSKYGIDEISDQKFVVSSVAHYLTLINAYTMVEAFSVPSGSVINSSYSIRQATLGERIKDQLQAALKK